LDHPAIVKVIDFGNVARVHASHPFLVLEFVTGVTLRQRMAQGQTPWPLAMTWLCETLEGLQVAHQRHIFHRDIKPDNLMITQDDHVKIVDFGFAREAGFTMTGSATNIGTPRYMSPEHLDAKTVSGASDLYSLGIVFYEVMSGAYPFVEAPGDTPYDTLARRLTAEPVDIGKHNPNLPRAVADVVMAMLSMRRDQRQVDPETARAVLQAAQGTV
jgi:serine/threonine-protein kinase